eukprot:6189472-Pleurochrysis_carterae.AAC.1
MVYVRRTRCRMDAVRGEEGSELVRQELARVVTVKSSDDSGRAIAAVAVQKRCEGRDEGAYGGGRITFGAQQVDSLESRMVVH